MQLELTLEEARVLNVAVDHILKHKELQEKVYAGAKDDITTFNGVAGKVRGLYEIEKRK